MSLILIDGKFVSFTKFFELKESIAPKSTDFGTDFEDRKWEISSDKKMALTFFSHTSDYQVCVSIILIDGEIGFGAYKGQRTSDLNLYDMSRTNLGAALKVFNKVMFVILEGAKTLNLDQVYFNGHDARLDKTYRNIANSKLFQAELKKANFEYIGRKNEYEEKFIFKKIKS